MTADSHEDEKRAAAEAAATLVEDGMAVGLGTGSTVAHFLPALARRDVAVRCVASSPATEESARVLGLAIEAFDSQGPPRLDLAVDGADQVAPDLWLVKGRGGAQTREKIIAAAADRFVVIVDETKVVDTLRPPVPLELMSFGLAATVAALIERGPVDLRESSRTPDGNVLADYGGEVGDPVDLSSWLNAIPGVVGHGLFASDLVDDVLIGRADGRVDHRSRPRL